jgi:hypothetical protein
MAATADAVIAKAISQIGGYFPGASPYGVWYEQKTNSRGFATSSFCAMGLSWAADQAGALDIIPLHAWTPSGVAWFKARGQWHAGVGGARRGDIVYFDFAGAPYRVSHVGIVENVNSDGSVNTIEFNTSGTAAGDQRNGRAVVRKRRKSYIVGYGRPAYVGSKPGAPAVDTRPKNRDGSLTIAVDGIRGGATISREQEVFSTRQFPLVIDGVISRPSALIERKQNILNDIITDKDCIALTGKARIKEDGIEGHDTVILEQFVLRNWVNPVHQQNLIGHPLAFDGVRGRETNLVLQFALNNAQAYSGTYPHV